MWRASSSRDTPRPYSTEPYSARPTNSWGAGAVKSFPGDVDRTMPKNFEQPLTCFYWHNYGECTKPDDECLYAHYNTGLVACAPVSAARRGDVSAGKAASATIADISRRERQLETWEANLADRQHSLTAREKELHIHPMSKVMDDAKQLLKTLQRARQVSASARRTLGRRYDETLNTRIDTDMRNTICNAFDGAIGGIVGFDAEIAHMERKIATQLGLLVPSDRAPSL